MVEDSEYTRRRVRDGVDVSLKRQRPFTLFARTTSGTGGTIDAMSLGWEEDW